MGRVDMVLMDMAKSLMPNDPQLITRHMMKCTLGFLCILRWARSRMSKAGAKSGREAGGVGREI